MSFFHIRTMRVLISILIVFGSLFQLEGRDPLSKILPQNGPSYDSARGKYYALVAGGSKGIGFAIAESLAKRGYNLVLIARGYDSLMAAKSTFEQTYNIKVHTVVYDLSKESAARDISKWCEDNGIQLKVLCNVAGLGGARDYLSLPLDSLRYMVNLNVESCMALSLLLIPNLERNAPSYILNVSSMAGLAPIPTKNMYSATKAAVISFSYGLRYQLKEKRISVSCLAPGPVFTKPFIRRETKKNLGWFGMKMAVPVERVGEVAVKRTLRRRMLIVPGTLASVSSAFIRILPKSWAARVYSKVGDK
jgi:uncharacterized protein